MSVERIRTDWLRDCVAGETAKLDDREIEDLVAKRLGQRMVMRLQSPRFRMEGARLGDATEFDAGRPGTSFPGDTYPRLFEAVLRTFTAEQHSVAYLFSTSRTPLVLGEQLARRAAAIDEHVTDVPGAHSGRLLDESAVDSVKQKLGSDEIDLLYVDLPLSGIVDKPDLLTYGETDLPSGRLHWEGLDRDDFFENVGNLLDLWSPHVSKDGHLLIEIGWCQWDEDPELPWPEIDDLAYERGWKLARQVELYFEPAPGPVDHPSLGHGCLLVLERRVR